MKRELPIPSDTTTAEQAVEVFRGWIIDEQLQCSILPTIWSDTPELWGMLLADAAHHIANAIEERTGEDSSKILAKIQSQFESEMDTPSDEHEGEFHKR